MGSFKKVCRSASLPAADHAQVSVLERIGVFQAVAKDTVER
jgi:hypothetical protein